MQRDASTTSGLARLRPLTAGKPEPSNIPKNLPDGWFYNESKEENIWKDLEKYDNVYASSVLEDENKRTQNTSQMGEASNKINKLIEKFEEIDQEVLGEMQKLFDADENDGNGDNDAEQFIQNEKASVVQFIEELNQYSDSQVYLLESLKKSFNAIQGTSSFLSMEASDQEKSPDPKIVIESLEKIFAENIDRAERASTLHHDVTNFWVHHLSSFKKVISKKNEDAIQKRGGASLSGFCRRNPSICWRDLLSGKCISDTERRIEIFLPHEARSAICEMISLSCSLQKADRLSVLPFLTGMPRAWI